jgi:hypothetical protein
LENGPALEQIPTVPDHMVSNVTCHRDADNRLLVWPLADLLRFLPRSESERVN